MTEEQLKTNIARNIATLRKKKGLTQTELAEKLSYSDKSVSKWERAEGIPDALVLTNMAELFGVTLNELVADELPAEKIPTEQHPHRRKVKIIVPIIAAILPLLLGTIAYTVLSILFPLNTRLWLIFVYAAAVSAIILIVFGHIWWNKVFGGVFVSSLIWITATCVFLTLRVHKIWLVFTVAAVLQILTILWYIVLPGKNPKNIILKKKKGKDSK